MYILRRKLTCLLILSLLSLFSSCATKNTGSLHQPTDFKTLEDIYRNAQREFNKKNFKESLTLFIEYIDLHRINPTAESQKRVFWVIDQVTRIYIQVYSDVNKGINFLLSITSDFQLSGTHREDISEWLSVLRKWTTRALLAKDISSPEKLYKLGEYYFQQGMEKLDSPLDNSGNADFYIASTYLVPYVYNHDRGKRIGRALFMLGNIRFKSWNDYEYWNDNFYLKEVIRRFPHSELSVRAYEVLARDVYAGFSNSGTKAIPPSQIEMLKVFKMLAIPNNEGGR